MKYCEGYAALLDGFVDGELDFEELERVRAHLESCPGCRAYVDDALAIRAGFPDVEDTVVPEGFAQGVMERVRKDGKTVEVKRRDFRRWTGTLAALAACCALVILLRSGPVGLNDRGSDTVSVESAMDDMETVTATTGAAGPEAYDMVRGAGENGIVAQAAPEEPMAADDTAPAGEAAESRMTTLDREFEESAQKKDSVSYAVLPAPAAVPEAALEEAPEEADAGILVYLSAEEAEGLPEGLTPVWETETERAYELRGKACSALLDTLGWEEEARPETVLAVVEIPLCKE